MDEDGRDREGEESFAGRSERADTGPVGRPLRPSPISGREETGRRPGLERRRVGLGSMRTADVAAADALHAQAFAPPTIKEVTRK